MTNDKQESADKIVGSTDGLGGVGTFARHAPDAMMRLNVYEIWLKLADVVEANAFAESAEFARLLYLCN